MLNLINDRIGFTFINIMLYIYNFSNFAILIALLALIFLIKMIINTLIYKQIGPPRMDTYIKFQIRNKN